MSALPSARALLAVSPAPAFPAAAAFLSAEADVSDVRTRCLRRLYAAERRAVSVRNGYEEIPGAAASLAARIGVSGREAARLRSASALLR